MNTATNIYYRLPVNMEFVAFAMRNELPDIIFYIDLLTGGCLLAPRAGGL